MKPEHQKHHPLPEQKRRPPPVPPLTKRPGLSQPRPHTNDQRLTRKLVEKSRAVLNRRASNKALAPGSISNQPTTVASPHPS